MDSHLRMLDREKRIRDVMANNDMTQTYKDDILKRLNEERDNSKDNYFFQHCHNYHRAGIAVRNYSETRPKHSRQGGGDPGLRGDLGLNLERIEELHNPNNLL